MKPWNQITHYAGFDWAKDHHDIVILDKEGHIQADFRIEHSAKGWLQWREQIRAFPALAVAIETSQGTAIEQLLESGVTVYPVNAKSAERYRDRHLPSGTKTDHGDAWTLADALRMDGHGWKALRPQDALTQELRLLCRDEVALIEQRTQLVNQLRQALYEYYPVILEVFDDWTVPHAWALVETFPTPQALAAAGRRRWEKFLHVHRLYHPDTYEPRLQCLARASEFTGSEPVIRTKSRLAVTLAKLLRHLEEQLRDYRKEIERLFAQHPDHELFGSLPGAGKKLAPRLLSEIGTVREIFPDAQSLQCLAGTAPVSFQSGQIEKVHLRHACNKHLRHAVHLWVDLSRRWCVWADTYYEEMRRRGKSHACALRCLGQRWLKIVWKMWQTHTCYDGELHARNQKKHGSWVLKLVTPGDPA